MRQLDLSSLASIKRFAQQLRKDQHQVDLLVCNAGIMAPPQRRITPDGFEQQFQVTGCINTSSVYYNCVSGCPAAGAMEDRDCSYTVWFQKRKHIKLGQAENPGIGHLNKDILCRSIISHIGC